MLYPFQNKSPRLDSSVFVAPGARIIGMGSTILDGAEIGEECIIGANTLIPPGKVIPPRSLVVGSPGKVVREITNKDLELIQMSIDTYVDKGKLYRESFA